MLGAATEEDLRSCRGALALIDERGYSREKNLLEEFDRLLQER